MIVFDDGFARIEWNEKATFNVIIGGREINCFTVYGIEDKQIAISEAQEHMQYFYEHID